MFLADFALKYNDFEKLSLLYWAFLFYLDHGLFFRFMVNLQ